jgi:hypothetical protein
MLEEADQDLCLPLSLTHVALFNSSRSSLAASPESNRRPHPYHRCAEGSQRLSAPFAPHNRAGEKRSRGSGVRPNAAMRGAVSPNLWHARAPPAGPLLAAVDQAAQRPRRPRHPCWATPAERPMPATASSALPSSARSRTPATGSADIPGAVRHRLLASAFVGCGWRRAADHARSLSSRENAAV